MLVGSAKASACSGVLHEGPVRKQVAVTARLEFSATSHSRDDIHMTTSCIVMTMVKMQEEGQYMNQVICMGDRLVRLPVWGARAQRRRCRGMREQQPLAVAAAP